MENKYYTPTIDEFHVGFEYEYLSSDSKIWSKCNIEENDLTSSNMDYCAENCIEDIFNKIKTNSIRVKYLDRDDIESLGWIPHANMTNVFYKESQNLYGTLYLNYNNYGKEILVEDDRTGDYLFKGNLKNKSELKRLMKQLGINE